MMCDGKQLNFAKVIPKMYRCFVCFDALTNYDVRRYNIILENCRQNNGFPRRRRETLNILPDKMHTESYERKGI